MNCKQGDLAVVVRSFAGQEGKIVRCVKYVGPINFDGAPAFPDCWRVDPPLYVAADGRKAQWVADSCMRPIRDSKGDDETLAWAGAKRAPEVPAAPQLSPAT